MPTQPSLAHRLISRSAFLASSAGTRYDKLVVGVAIFHPHVSDSKPFQVLVVQRSTQENFLPGVYELPGGHVEDSDSSILQAAAREVLEETGLVVDEIIGEIPPFEYSVDKEGASGMVETTIQLNFVAKVLAASSMGVLDVIVNPQEHQNFAWVSKEDLKQLKTTEEMKIVINDALVWAEKNPDRLR